MVSVLCIICLNTTKSSQLVAVEKCGHVFHTTCLNKWLTGDGRALRQCPQCRTPISKHHQIFINFEDHWDEKQSESIPDEINKLIENLKSDANKLSDKVKKLESKYESTAKALDSMKKKAEELRKLNRDQEKQLTHLQKELSSVNKEAEQYRVLKGVLDVKVVEIEPQTDLASANLIIKSLRHELIESQKKNNRLVRANKPAPLKDLSLYVNEVLDVGPRYNTRLSTRNSSKSAFYTACAGKGKPVASNNGEPEKASSKRKAVSEPDVSCIIISDDDDNNTATTENANGRAKKTGGAAKRTRKNIYEFVDKI